MIDVVTDVLAFAAKRADYWEEILSEEQDFDSVLSEGELKAFQAARAHIVESVHDLLRTCGTELAKRAAADGQTLAVANFQRDTAQQKRSVQVLKQRPAKVYGAFFSLEPDSPGGIVKLYASVAVYKEILDNTKAALSAAKVDFDVDNYSVYTPGIELEEKKTFAELAGTAADRLWNLLKYAK